MLTFSALMLGSTCGGGDTSSVAKIFSGIVLLLLFCWEICKRVLSLGGEVTAKSCSLCLILPLRAPKAKGVSCPDPLCVGREALVERPDFCDTADTVGRSCS